MEKKPKLSFWNIWNMSFGFLGIQFGFALQGGSMSRIFVTLGASKDSIPMLWIFAPLAGLIVQPIIGYMSDRTWNPTWGRRKPYFFIGAVLASLVLVFMPYSPVLWVAVGSLLLLDSSINVSMEPFRALVADLLPESQRSYGFVVQTLIIGIGTWVASQLPLFLKNLGVSNVAAENVIPDNVKMSLISLIVGGVGFLLMLTTKDQTMLNICFACIGIAWGSILSMPYAMLSSAIDPNKMGLFMGLFNMFIVLPQILAAVGLTWIYTTFIGEASINAMVLAGICLIIAGLSNLLITNPNAIRYQGEKA